MSISNENINESIIISNEENESRYILDALVGKDSKINKNAIRKTNFTL